MVTACRSYITENGTVLIWDQEARDLIRKIQVTKHFHSSRGSLKRQTHPPHAFSRLVVVRTASTCTRSTSPPSRLCNPQTYLAWSPLRFPKRRFWGSLKASTTNCRRSRKCQLSRFLFTPTATCTVTIYLFLSLLSLLPSHCLHPDQTNNCGVQN